ncbi:DUF2384 domain-containing protein [Burkholderia sp. Bp9125]|jgi:uncharacterized protein (DUF2384 family)|nr:DUF2384 domain-containing protein [Burkholderia sp. Bp9125]
MEDFPKGWDGFVEFMRTEWIDNDVTRELSRLVSDSDLAVAIWGCLKEESVTWLDYKVPALKKRRPIDLLKSEKGRAEIRWILISNPWWPAMGKRNEPN